MNNVLSYSNKATNKSSNNSANLQCTNAFVIRSGQNLFRMGDKLKGIYLVNSGCVKTFRTTESGEEQITAFCLPGDLVGLDAMSDSISRSAALVLDTSNLTLIPFSAIMNRTNDFEFQSFMHKVGKALIRDHDHNLMLSQRTADRRVAWFLLEFSKNLASRQLSPEEFTLPMTRTDIALFLGLAIETVCRELANLCENGLVQKNRRHIKLLNMPQLRKVAIGADVDAGLTYLSPRGCAA